MQTERVTLYTDGSCYPNPGPGGWGAALVAPGSDPERPVLGLSGPLQGATNNTAELLAATKALEVLKGRYKVLVVTDSLYVAGPYMDGRIVERRKRFWQDHRGADILNAEFFRELDIQVNRHSVQFHWVKGHEGNPGNEFVDFLAGEARKTQKGQKISTTWAEVVEKYTKAPKKRKA